MNMLPTIKSSPQKKKKLPRLLKFGATDTTPSAKRYMTSLQGVDPHSKSKWVTDYRSNTTKWRGDRRIEKQKAEQAEMEEEKEKREAAKKMTARLAVSRELVLKARLEPIDDAAFSPVQEWMRSHNSVCELSGLFAPPAYRAECKYCPVVVRIDVLKEHEKARASACAATIALLAAAASVLVFPVIERLEDWLLQKMQKDKERAELKALKEKKGLSNPEDESDEEGTEDATLEIVRLGTQKWEKKVSIGASGAGVDFATSDGRSGKKLSYEAEMAGLPFARTSHLVAEERWVCPQCCVDVHTTRRMVLRERHMHETNERRERAAISVQACLRMKQAYDRLKNYKSGMIRLQAVARACQSRAEFQAHHIALKRPLRLRIVSATNLAAADFVVPALLEKAEEEGGPLPCGLSDPYVIACMLHPHNPEVQLHRFDSKHKTQTLNPVWEQGFFVPGAPGDATWAFTIVDYDDASSRDEFLGQAVIRLKDTTVWRTGGRFEVPLEDMLITPKEGNNTTVRMGNSDFEGQGKIVVELQPMRVSCSLCSTLEEVNSSFGSGRRWWAVLAEGYLRLYKHFGAPKERFCVSMRDISKVMVTKPSKAAGIIVPQLEVRTSEKTWLFEHNDLPTIQRWSVKLKNAVAQYNRPANAPYFIHDANGDLVPVDPQAKDAEELAEAYLRSLELGLNDEKYRNSMLRKNSLMATMKRQATSKKMSLANMKDMIAATTRMSVKSVGRNSRKLL